MTLQGDPRHRPPRPPATVAGAVLLLLRTVAGTHVLIATNASWDALLTATGRGITSAPPSPEFASIAHVAVMTTGSAAIAIDALLALLVFRGHNFARVGAMALATASICASFLAWWTQGQVIRIDGVYALICINVLLLVALSGRSAAAYATGRRKQSAYRAPAL